MGSPQVIYGTCDGTAAVINVCLGFIPRYVKVWNVDDTTNLPMVEWLSAWGIITAVAEGIKQMTLAVPVYTLLTVAGNRGIRAYDGGDVIKYDKNTSGRWEVVTAFPGGASVEEVYVDGAYERTATTDDAYKCIGDTICPDPFHGEEVITPPGFTIAIVADLNVDGDQLFWQAIR
jgi:hypothetical protein